MCEKYRRKKFYCNPRKDECIREEIKKINDNGILRTLASCCGHKRYPKTIVVMERESKKVYELFSGVYLGIGRRKGNRYYKSDPMHHYFIPEVFTYYLSRSWSFKNLAKELVACLWLADARREDTAYETLSWYHS